MGHLNVDTTQLLAAAADYDELSMRTALLSPLATTEVQRIADSHGLIGYPAALGIAAGLANAEQPVLTKATDFQTYSQILTEHAATYTPSGHRHVKLHPMRPRTGGEHHLAGRRRSATASATTGRGLCRWSINHLPYFAVPRYIEFRSALPKNPVGRVLKYVLRDEGATANTWDREAVGIVIDKR